MAWMERLREARGKTAMYYRDLTTGDTYFYNEDMPLVAASVIKIPVMVEAFRAINAGELDPLEEVEIRPEIKKPSCGVLTYLHDGLKVQIRDLIELMIIVSDNTATNILIDRLGVKQVNDTMTALGIEGICLRRTLFNTDPVLSKLNNTVTARGVGEILTRMYEGTLLGKETDETMLAILRDQRLNGKMPFFLKGTKIAHKTGEDDETTHDVGVIYTPRPFVLCMLSNETDVPAFERLIQDTALALAMEHGK